VIRVLLAEPRQPQNSYRSSLYLDIWNKVYVVNGVLLAEPSQSQAGGGAWVLPFMRKHL
jgi:hypothetical protein